MTQHVSVFQDPDIGDIAYALPDKTGYTVVELSGSQFNFVTAASMPDRFVPVRPAPTLEEVASSSAPSCRAGCGVIRMCAWAGMLLVDLDGRAACYCAGDFFAAAESWRIDRGPGRMPSAFCAGAGGRAGYSDHRSSR